MSNTQKITFADVRQSLNLTVWVAALGYFVDIFDIALFGVVRIASLKDIGYTDPQEILQHGLTIYNWGMVGMMIGGLFWGVLADKFGRLSVMFGSILLYSLGTLANAYVGDVFQYSFCRFITGIGLAGELGAAITLVSESLPTRLRGIGTTVVAGLGLLGSVAAAIVGQKMHWQHAYLLGGGMGLVLLVTRFQVRESLMFVSHGKTAVSRGNVMMLMKGSRAKKYLWCVLAGMPIYFITGILFTFSPELTRELGVQGTVTAGISILFGTVGLSLGDFISGILSQALKSRKKSIGISLAVAFATMLVYLGKEGLTPMAVYLLCFAVGTAAGYWAVLVTVSAEQFGTNIRGTVATTVPNFVRGSAILSTIAFTVLKEHMALPHAALLIGVVNFGLAAFALWRMEETFSKDLDYVEAD